jgi:quercetin dioxygenase-like cupin family protein
MTTRQTSQFLRKVDFPALAASSGRYVQTLLDPLNSDIRTCEVSYIKTPADGGSREGLHYHDVDQAFFLLSGTMMVEIGGETHTAEPGTLIVFPAGVPHRNWNVGSETVHLVMMAPAPEPNKPKGTQVKS